MVRGTEKFQYALAWCNFDFDALQHVLTQVSSCRRENLAEQHIGSTLLAEMQGAIYIALLAKLMVAAGPHSLISNLLISLCQFLQIV